MRDLGVVLTAELALQREGHGQREQRQSHADGVARGQHTEHHVGREEQHVVEDVRECRAGQDGERDDACTAV